MTSSVLHTVALTCHPQTPSHAVYSMQACVGKVQPESLGLTFTLVGELARLRIPPLLPSCKADRLWQHTCFETFITVPGQPAYWEFNFSPSSEWAIYAFHSYRENMPLPEKELAPEISVHRSSHQLDLNAALHFERLPSLLSHSRLRLALSAVIEEIDGSLSYWALNHPTSKPDFHHPDAFVLEIELAEHP